MVEIKPYLPEDFEMLRVLHMVNSSDTANDITPETMPAIGFKVIGEDTGYVCAGFLRLVEGGYAQFDTLVSNPRYSSEIRHEAMCLLVKTIVQTAKDMKLKGILALTRDKTIIMRAVATGFHVTDHTVIALPLGDL